MVLRVPETCIIDDPDESRVPYGDRASVPDLLLDFSIKLKEYLRTKEPSFQEEAEALYKRLVVSMPSTDPRRASLDTLKDLLR